MKICLISNLKDNGYGESTRPYYLSLELTKIGYGILHICDKKTQVKDGIQYLSKKHFTFSSQSFNRVFNFIFLFIKVRLFNPDFIYIQQFNNGQWAIATRTLPGVPKVYDAHTSLYFECKTHGKEAEILNHVFSVEKEICTKSNYIVAASDETKSILKELYGLPDSKMFVVKNATAIQPNAVSEILNNRNFICSATIPFDGFKSNEMALEFLFDVAKELYEMNKEIRIQVIGGGEKPVPPILNITYTGYVNDLKTTLLQSHVCLSPYPEKAVSGGARNKVCDYLALGKAVISTKEGIRGFNDLINGQHYLEANSTYDFAAAIVKLCSDVSLRKTIEQNALAISHNYQWNKRGLELNSFFKSILK